VAASSWSDGPAKRLDQMIEAARVSNAQLQRDLGRGFHNSAIHRWRTGERVPRADSLARLLERIGRSADEVLGLPHRPAFNSGGEDAALASVLGALEDAQAATAESSAKLAAAAEALKRRQ